MRCRASAPLSRNEPACAVAAVGTVDRIIEDLVPLTLSGTRSLPLARPLARRSPPSLTSIPLEPLEAVICLRIAPQAACLTFTPVRIRIIDGVPCHVPISQLHSTGSLEAAERGAVDDGNGESGGERRALQHDATHT